MFVFTFSLKLFVKIPSTSGVKAKSGPKKWLNPAGRITFVILMGEAFMWQNDPPSEGELVTGTNYIIRQNSLEHLNAEAVVNRLP